MELSPHLPITDEDRWQAVADRDEAFDGAFVFAVATTGIYCRPSCPSRRAKRGNVQFYALPEAAGFRACLRCRPRDTRATDPKIDALRRLCRYMESSDEGPPTLDTLSKMAGLSPHYLQRSFKRLVGVTPRQYYDALRIERLKSSLRGGDRVTGALFEAGYGSTSRLYEAAPSQLGMTPAAYAKGGKGAVIAYAITDSPLDRLLVGATARGIAAVYLGDNDGALEQALHGEYPAALIGRDDGGLGRWIEPLLAHLEGREPHLALPLDVRATAFQRQVWEALRAIPYGETRSYGQIAAAIGKPKAGRAVARACATNQVSLVVPCHRVIGANGALAGYRWGVARKKKLLKKEQAGPKT
jgi:AraC family transcriptional regulator of adaptative response/methylated-DNA-[protein]-cysteine methyltransferase